MDRKKFLREKHRFEVGERAWCTWTQRETRGMRRFNVRGRRTLVTIMGRKGMNSCASGIVYRVRIPACCNTCGSNVVNEHWLDEGWFQKTKRRK